MAELNGEEAEVQMTVEIKRKTGEIETHTIIGKVSKDDFEKLKEQEIQ